METISPQIWYDGHIFSILLNKFPNWYKFIPSCNKILLPEGSPEKIQIPSDRLIAFYISRLSIKFYHLFPFHSEK